MSEEIFKSETKRLTIVMADEIKKLREENEAFREALEQCSSGETIGWEKKYIARDVLVKYPRSK